MFPFHPAFSGRVDYIWSMTTENPSVQQQVQRLHDAAARRGDSGYIDPRTGLMVLTATYLKARAYCCGAGCRHCPYPADIQRAAGRPPNAPCWSTPAAKPS